jgi:Tfp pilus assembly protein PilF
VVTSTGNSVQPEKGNTFLRLIVFNESMNKAGFFGAILLLFIFSVPATAQNGTVRGKVRTASGVTLSGVIVELWRTGARIGQVVTTSEGDFSFAELTPDIYEITIQHDGYDPVSERAEFRFPPNSGQREIVTLEIRLKPLSKEKFSAPPGTTFVREVPDAARELFEKGVSKLKEGNSAEGVEFLQQATTIFPDYFNAHLALGIELSKQDKLQEAISSLESARKINDQDGRVYHLFGVIMARQQKYSVAEYAFRRAVERDPTNAQSRFSHGLTLLEVALRTEGQEQQSALATAERELQKALDLTGQKLVAAYLHLARICELRGDRKAASEMLETYLKLNPEDKNAPAIREAMAKLKSWRPLR